MSFTLSLFSFTKDSCRSQPTIINWQQWFFSGAPSWLVYKLCPGHILFSMLCVKFNCTTMESGMHAFWLRQRVCKIIYHHHSPSFRFPTNFCSAIGAENSRWKDQDHLKACPSLARSRRHHELWRYWCRDRNDWEEVPWWYQRLLPSHIPALAQWERIKTLYMGYTHWTARGLRPRGTHGRHSIRTVSIS